jgi:hypothetical protein
MSLALKVSVYATKFPRNRCDILPLDEDTEQLLRLYVGNALACSSDVMERPNLVQAIHLLNEVLAEYCRATYGKIGEELHYANDVAVFAELDGFGNLDGNLLDYAIRPEESGAVYGELMVGKNSEYRPTAKIPVDLYEPEIQAPREGMLLRFNFR